MEWVLDGRTIGSEAEFHKEIGLLLGLGPYYGANLDALWDRLSTDVERPVVLLWKYSSESRRRLGAGFELIVSVLERVKRQDEEWSLKDSFDYRLE